jgi:hypothetical protein
MKTMMTAIILTALCGYEANAQQIHGCSEYGCMSGTPTDSWMKHFDGSRSHMQIAPNGMGRTDTWDPNGNHSTIFVNPHNRTTTYCDDYGCDPPVYVPPSR